MSEQNAPTVNQDEDRQFNEYAAKKAREDRERESGHEECPKCQSHNTHAGYGLAAGGIGCYTICMDCGHVLSSVQDAGMAEYEIDAHG